MNDIEKARLKHVLATVVDGVAWFMAFAMIGFTDRKDFGGILAAMAMAGAAVSALLARWIGRSTSMAARFLDDRVKSRSASVAIAATFFLPIARQLGEGYAFSRAAEDVTVATDERDLRRRVQRMSDARTVIHGAAYAMFLVRFAGFEELSRVVAFGLGIGGVFLTALTGRMLLAPLEREARRRRTMRSLGAASNAVTVGCRARSLH